VRSSRGSATTLASESSDVSAAERAGRVQGPRTRDVARCTWSWQARLRQAQSRQTRSRRTLDATCVERDVAGERRGRGRGRAKGPGGGRAGQEVSSVASGSARAWTGWAASVRGRRARGAAGKRTRVRGRVRMGRAAETCNTGGEGA
jgi:hypothetical protein